MLISFNWYATLINCYSIQQRYIEEILGSFRGKKHKPSLRPEYWYRFSHHAQWTSLYFQTKSIIFISMLWNIALK